MGCWNDTCALTNLPVMRGDDVYVFLLQKSAGDSPSLCYPTDFWTPVIFFFEGKYDDYGSVEECHGPLLNYIVDGIRDMLFEFDVGKNECHDIAVKKEGFNIELLFEADNENRLYVHTSPILQFPKDRIKLKHIVIHKKVLDNILSNYIENEYQMVNDEYEKVPYTFDNLHTDIKAKYKKTQQSSVDIRYIEMSHSGGVLGPRGREIEGYGAIFYVGRSLIDASDKPELVDAMLYQISVMSWLYSFMSTARKTWTPSTGGGSQDQDTVAQRLLATITLQEASALDQRYNEEYDED